MFSAIGIAFLRRGCQDALGGLKEYYPKLLDPEVAGSIREVVRKYFAASGNQQADYERVRDMVENIVK